MGRSNIPIVKLNTPKEVYYYTKSKKIQKQMHMCSQHLNATIFTHQSPPSSPDVLVRGWLVLLAVNLISTKELFHKKIHFQYTSQSQRKKRKA